MDHTRKRFYYKRKKAAPKDPVINPDESLSDIDKPEVNKSEVNKPEINKPEVTISEGSKSENNKPEVTKSEGSKSENNKPEVSKPEANKSELQKPEIKPDANKPFINKPDTNKPPVYKSQQPRRVGIKPDFKKPASIPQRPQLNVANNNQMISVVIPLLNEEESLNELSREIEKVFDFMKCNYEVIFIDDGSTDNSYNKIKEINRRNNKFHCIKLRRNYGKSAALAKGFSAAKGNIVITMDADLQDDPAEIPDLVKVLNSGYDLVSGWKKVRYDPFIKKHTSKLFNYFTSKLSGVKLHDFNCGLKAYKKDVVKSVNIYGEMHRYIPAIAHLSGFKVTEKPVKHQARKYGVTKFGASRFINGFLDLLTVIFTNRYMKRPLHFFGSLGIASSMLGVLVTIYLIVLKYIEGKPLSDRPLFLVGIFLIIVGIQFLSLGLIAEMITKSNIKDDDVLTESNF
ncbi:MAG: glycosyltransferase [bacterium]|nr:glycosyltransferase [bacterium]